MTKRGLAIVVSGVLTLLGIPVVYVLEGYDLPIVLIIAPAVIPFMVWRLLLVNASWHDVFPKRRKK